MNEETKKLFNAPWEVNYDGENEDMWITNKDRKTVADIPEESKEGERISYLPELYEALEEAVEEVCGTCAMMMVDSNSYDFVHNGCPFYEDHDDCLPIKWLELLRKVKEGKA